jgi:hypothetical protein
MRLASEDALLIPRPTRSKHSRGASHLSLAVSLEMLPPLLRGGPEGRTLYQGWLGVLGRHRQPTFLKNCANPSPFFS